jgi:serine/threonine-protein kinase
MQERESSFEQDGRVIGQIPEGGTSKEVGSQVTITVGTGPSTVEVPDLYGNTPDQAAALLGDVGLELGAVSEDYSADVAEGGIMYQDPAAGASVEPGSAVNVTTSLGPEQVEVPDVYGLDLATAQDTVANAGFYYEVVEVEPSNDEPAGTALSTEPAAGTLLDPGATVTIYHSSGPPEPTEPDRGGGGNDGAKDKKENKGQAKENKGDRGKGKD